MVMMMLMMHLSADEYTTNVWWQRWWQRCKHGLAPQLAFCVHMQPAVAPALYN
jgi:hypothetical protein